MPSEIANSLAVQFATRGLTWKINGVPTIPLAQDFDDALDKAKELLYAEPIPSQLEVGRLIIRRYAEKKFDVYLHQGDIND